MTKTKTQSSTDVQNGTDKQRKKLAKREARLMLKLERARRKVQKAELKVAKVRSKLEANEQLVQKVEQQLARLRGARSDMMAPPEMAGKNGTQQEAVPGDAQPVQPALVEPSEQVAPGEPGASVGSEVRLPVEEGQTDVFTPQGEEEPQGEGANSGEQVEEVAPGEPGEPAVNWPVEEGQTDVFTPQDEHASLAKESTSDTEQKVPIAVTEETTTVPAKSEEKDEGQH